MVISRLVLRASSPSNRAAVVSPDRATTPLSVCTLRRSISIVVICASTTVLRNPYCTIRLYKVFVLLIGSSSSSYHYPRRC
ncbi:hypothetical protein BDA96_03G170500 [Sorghum bicolor]|uniref:Uncharacterized protein n=2 Tax=Sorghum bicolor TaxID=4558 RepID=A0A921RD00_SORBI|nr:hypothetical protein BDA96_03G170500 [Sorghum bicolor]KXG32494.1 hypothetical protein SORBI_3003G161900 [Sorghum bicolor]